MNMDSEFKRRSEALTPEQMALTRYHHKSTEGYSQCACYPPSRGYDRSMAKGCRGGGECWVANELREGATEEGRMKYRARYFAQLADRAKERP